MTEIRIAGMCSPWIQSKNTIWETVLHLGRRCLYEKDNIIAGNGESVDHLFYLYSGRIKLSMINEEGTEKILWYLERGNLFGEVPFLERLPMDASFAANSDCEVYMFSRDCVESEILTKHPALVLNLLESLAHKARVFSVQACNLHSLIGRICKVLIYIVQREHGIGSLNGKVSCKRGIPQPELASILGVHRVTLNQALSQLKREGILGTIGKQALVINDFQRLLQVAATDRLH